MQRIRSIQLALSLVVLFLLQSASPLVNQTTYQPSEMESEGGIEWVHFDLVEGVFSDAVVPLFRAGSRSIGGLGTVPHPTGGIERKQAE